jgi:cytochrome c oxidase subunit 1
LVPNTRLTKIHFILIFISVNLTFFPIHFRGLAGIPRRYPDYPVFYTQWNMVASVGAILGLFTIILFFYILWESILVKNIAVSYSHLGVSLE